MKKPVRQTDSVPTGSLPTTIIPRLLRIQDVARYLSATNWFVEELLRNGKLRFVVAGKRKVVDVKDVDEWIEAQKKHEEPAKLLTDEEAQEFFRGVEKDEDGNYIVKISLEGAEDE